VSHGGKGWWWRSQITPVLCVVRVACVRRSGVGGATPEAKWEREEEDKATTGATGKEGKTGDGRRTGATDALGMSKPGNERSKTTSPRGGSRGKGGERRSMRRTDRTTDGREMVVIHLIGCGAVWSFFFPLPVCTSGRNSSHFFVFPIITPHSHPTQLILFQWRAVQAAVRRMTDRGQLRWSTLFCFLTLLRFRFIIDTVTPVYIAFDQVEVPIKMSKTALGPVFDCTFASPPLLLIDRCSD
jgi:hypothetical protein